MTQNQPWDVRELQQQLRTIAFYTHTLPLIAVDGIYGPETTIAVEQFQREHRIPVTGTVDLITWEMIRAEYLRVTGINNGALNISPFPGANYVIGPGDHSDLIAIVQIMLNVVSKQFSNLDGVPVDGRYGEATEQAVKKLQEKAGLQQTGIVDQLTWNAIASAYNYFN